MDNLGMTHRKDEEERHYLAPHTLKSHGKYLYEIIEDENIEQVLINQAWFNGVLFRNCLFRGVGFERTNFDSVRMENCEFINCSFASTDHKSSLYSNVSFKNCAFNGSLIEDCYYNDCLFYETDLTQASFTNNKVLHSLYDTSIITAATFVKNLFIECNFNNMALADCTFCHQIFRNCNFLNTSMCLDDLGQSFGISEQNMNDIVFLNFNLEQLEFQGDVVEHAIELYAETNRQIHNAIVNLNFKSTNVYSNLNNLVISLCETISLDRPIKLDEVDFIGSIFEELNTANRLPLFAITFALSKLEDLLRSTENVSFEITKKSLQRILLYLQSIAISILEELSIDTKKIGNIYSENTFCVRMTEMPRAKISETINLLLLEYEMNSGNEARFIEYRQGSVIEVLVTTYASIIMLRFIIRGLTGIVVDFNDLGEAAIETFNKRDNPLGYSMSLMKNISTTVSPFVMEILKKSLQIAISKKIVDLIEAINTDSIISIFTEK